jgi:hypothetical protein
MLTDRTANPPVARLVTPKLQHNPLLSDHDLAPKIRDGSSRNGGMTRVAYEQCPCLSRFSHQSRPSRLSQESTGAAESLRSNAGYFAGFRLIS